MARQYATSKPTHLPALSWVAKPGTPVSTPQASMPRFLMVSTVGPGQLTPWACAPFPGRSSSAAPNSPASKPFLRRAECPVIVIDPPGDLPGQRGPATGEKLAESCRQRNTVLCATAADRAGLPLAPPQDERNGPSCLVASTRW